MAQTKGAYLGFFTFKDSGNGLRAFHHTSHAPECFLEVQTTIHSLFHQVGDNFGIGFRFEGMTTVSQTPLQFQVILNNTVVNHGNAVLAVNVGMSVFV